MEALRKLGQQYILFAGAPPCLGIGVRMRVLLVHPGTSSLANTYAYPPWGAILTATTLRAASVEAEVADLNGLDIPSSLPRLLDDFRPDVIGVTGKMGLGADRARETGRVAKQWCHGLMTVLGGPLVGAFGPSLEQGWKEYDAFLPGDGEDGIVRWLVSGRPRGLQSYSSSLNLDSAGIPSWWEGLAAYVGPAQVWPGLDVPALHVSASRGCTSSCRFCYLAGSGRQRNLQYVSVGRMLTDLERLSEKFGPRGFFFVDDCFLDAEGARLAALEAAAFRHPEMRFGCDLQLWQLSDDRLLERMRSVGFRSFYVGLEAGSASVRAQLGKGGVLEDAYRSIRSAIDSGFAVRASVGIGWPGETEADVRETLDLLKALPELKIDAFRYTPLPMAPLTAQLTAESARALDIGEWPFLDYCWRGRNFSDLSDDIHFAAWEALLAIQDERHGLVSMNGVAVPRSHYDAADGGYAAGEYGA